MSTHNRYSHKHLADVATDYRLSTADLLICSETRFSVNDSTQDIALPGFQLPFRNDESSPTHQRPAHGMAVYVTPNKNFTTSSTQHNYKSVEVTLTTISHALDQKVSNLNVVGIYSAPRTQLNHLKRAIQGLIEKENLQNTPTVLLGDFNIDISHQSPQSRQLLTFLKQYNFSTTSSQVMQQTISNYY